MTTDHQQAYEELRDERSGILVERPTGPAQYRMWARRIDDFLEWSCGRGEACNPNGHATWRNNIRLARGEHWAEQLDNSEGLNAGAELIDDRVTVSHISLHIENLVAFLAQNDPYFKCKGRRPQDVDSAKAQEAVLNYFWRELRYTSELKKCIRDYATIGHMVARTDWHSQEELDFQRPDKTKDPEATTNYNPYIRRQRPGFRRVNPFTFLLDRTTPTYDLKGARWCGELIARPLADIVADGRYNKTVCRHIRNGAEQVRTLREHLTQYDDGGEGLLGEMDAQDNEQDQLGLLVEIWDKRFRMRYVFALGVETPLIEEPWPYDYLDDFPYEFANFIPVPNEIYGLSHPHIAGQAQLLLDRLLTKMAMHARKHNPMYRMDKGALDDEEKTKFINNEDGGLFETNPGKKGPEPVELAQLPYDLQAFTQLIKGEMNELMNTDALHRGAALPSRTSAQEIEARQQLHGMKLSDHAATIDDFVRGIARMILQHIKTNLEQPLWVQIAGREGEGYVEVGADEVQGEYDVDIDSSSREVLTPAVEREQRMTLLQTLTALAGQGIPLQINWNELVKQVIDGFDGVEKDKIFPAMGEAPPPPAAPTYTPAQQASPNAPAPQPPPTGVNLAQSARQQERPL